MDIITIIYIAYSVIAFYFLFLFILIYFQNRGKIFYYPEYIQEYSLSMVVPCYNKEKTIANTIQALLDSSYNGLKKIIVVDDCSTDNSYSIIKDFAKKFPKKIVALQTKENTGKASGTKNYGAKFVDTELIGFTDADSYPEKNAIKQMIGFFDTEKTGAVTSQVLVKKREKFIEKLQAIEYKVIAFTRKLLGFVDSIYVTPGPLAIYRKKIFDEVGGFDESNMTEDIEITWNIISRGYKVEMPLPSKVYTSAPEKFRGWYGQRIRWNIGGLQTMNKYKNVFLKKGMLGTFVLPLFILYWCLGLFGLIVLSYRIFRESIIQVLSTGYSIETQSAILTLRDINLTPNVLVFFGMTIFFLSLVFTITILAYLKEDEFKKTGLLSLLIYMFVYLTLYPLMLVTSLYKFLKGKYSW